MTEIEQMLTSLLSCKRTDLYTKDITFNNGKFNQLLTMLKRRENGEPLQYILGEAEFMGLDFKVDKRVLIPRPETEIITEKAIELSKNNSISKILDLCTGCGNIAVSLVCSLPNVEVFASDISVSALSLAKKNALRHKMQKKIKFVQSDLFKAFTKRNSPKFDFIVSNPPYVRNEEIDTLQKEVRREPRIALDAGVDGLDFYRRIINNAALVLKKDGFVLLEIGFGQVQHIKKIVLSSKRFILQEIIKDYRNIDRGILLKLK